MKKYLFKGLSLVLLMAMLISTFAGVTAVAEEATAQANTEPESRYKEIVNLYELQGYGIPTGTAHAAFNGDTGYASSHLIPVQEGDVIYFGLVDITQKWHIDTYRADDSRVSVVSKGDAAANFTAVVHQDLDGTLGILKWTVPAGYGVTQIRLTSRAKLQDVMITKNQPFDYETMLKIMPLRNYYTVWAQDLLPGNTVDTTTALSGYTSSELISVTPGDVLYFGLANTSQGWHMNGYDANGAYVSGSTLTRNNHVNVEREKYVYSEGTSNRGILKWTVPANVTQMRFTTSIKDNPMIITKNQPFTVDIWTKITTGSDAELAYATYAENLLTHSVVFKNEYIYAGVGLAGSKVDTAPDGTAGFYTSEAISVTAGDVIYAAMLDPTQGWNIRGYRADGTSTTTYAGRMQIANEPNTQFIHERISEKRAIIKWTVPADVTSIRITSWVNDYPMLVTKNQPFDVEFYYKAMLPNNVYQPSSYGIPGADINTVSFNDTGYVASEPIAVKAGDVIYFGPCSTSQGWFIASYTGLGAKVGTVSASNSTEYATISDTETIRSWTVPSGVTHIKLTWLYKYCKTAVVTINQPFDLKAYNLYLSNLTASNYGYGNEIEESPLNNMSALFMGDSITAGSYDMMNPAQGKSWAGRFAATTGLKIKNAGVGGSAIATRATDTRWVFDQYTANKANAYDLVIMGGGVNDARSKVAIGEILDIDDAATLEASVDLSTFAGGMQWLFYNVRSTWKDAKLFYIANFRLDGHNVGNAQDMSAYFAVAKTLCEKYGVTFIDLYNNTELNMLLQSVDTRYMPDRLHPTSDGYDIIFPYIREAVESEIMNSLLKVDININEANDIRLLTTVDTLVYKSVGFTIQRASDGKVATISDTSVYTSVLVSKVTTTAQDISGYALSEYVAAMIITGAPSGETITVTAFLEYEDGRVVYGEGKTVTIP